MARKRRKPQNRPGQEAVRDSSQVDTPTARSTDPMDTGAEQMDVQQGPDRFVPPPDSYRQQGRGSDQLPGQADTDLGAAGGGASGPGSAQRNYPGANSGGAVAGAGTGGVTEIDTGISHPEDYGNVRKRAPRSR